MVVTVLSRKISLNASVDDWELFDMPGSEDAVAHINRTIVEAVEAGDDRREVNSKALRVMRLYSDLGATDSEPIWYLEHILNKIFGE